MSVCVDASGPCGRIRTGPTPPPRVCGVRGRWRCAPIGSFLPGSDHQHPIGPDPGYLYRARLQRAERRAERDRAAAYALLRELRGEKEEAIIEDGDGSFRPTTADPADFDNEDDGDDDSNDDEE